MCAVAPAGITSVNAEPLVATSSNHSPGSSSQQFATTPACSLDEIDWLLDGTEKHPGVPFQTRVVTPVAQETSGPELREVPPAPSSAALALCALLSLGAYEGGRSLRRLHAFAVVPEWYHTDGPQQIGHATPFELGAAALPICVFEEPSDLRPNHSYRIPREHRSRLRPQFFLLIEAPRGPPRLS